MDGVDDVQVASASVSAAAVAVDDDDVYDDDDDVAGKHAAHAEQTESTRI
ncbi:MAG TPA: hypothetical protein V6C97_26370 [Oculatellaceae cyanobacterium]